MGGAPAMLSCSIWKDMAARISLTMSTSRAPSAGLPAYSRFTSLSECLILTKPWLEVLRSVAPSRSSRNSCAHCPIMGLVMGCYVTSAHTLHRNSMALPNLNLASTISVVLLLPQRQIGPVLHRQ